MAKKALPTLTGGLNELTRNDLIGDSQLQISNNYEVVGDGTLKLRKASEQYSETLDTLLRGIYTDTTIMSEPYYPQKMLVAPTVYEPTEDFLLLFFGQTTHGYYEMHMVFKYLDDNGDEAWTQYVTWDDADEPENTLNDLLTDQDITFNSTAEPQFTMGSDRVIITDGKNKAYFIRINSEGELETSTFGIPPPQNRPRLDPIQRRGGVGDTTFPSQYFTTNAEATRVTTAGLFQCVYTVVDEYGEESNPSPISPTLDIQYFQLDEDNIDSRWVSGVKVQDLSLPTAGIEVIKTLKYFRIYHRTHRYSENLIAKNFEFAEDFLIKKKFKDDGTANDDVTNTGNDYTISVEADPGNTASYEKDVAPIAKKSSELSGVVMLGNVVQGLKIPWDFKHVVPIEISNLNSKSYVDAKIHIKINQEEINHLTLSDYYDLGQNQFPIMINKQHIRIFDQDLTTPLYVASTQRENNATMFPNQIELTEVWLTVMIPLLPSLSKHTIYLTWNPSEDMSNNGGSYTGVPNKYNDLAEISNPANHNWVPWDENIGIHYGRFLEISEYDDLGDDDDRNEIFHFDRVINDSTILTTFFGDFYDLRNRADGSKSGDGNASYVLHNHWADPYQPGQIRGQRIPTNQYGSAFNPYFGNQAYIYNGDTDNTNNYIAYHDYDLTMEDSKGTVFFVHKPNFTGGTHNWTIFSLGADGNARWRFGYREDAIGSGGIAHPIIMNNASTVTHSFTDVIMNVGTNTDTAGFFCVSWDDDVGEYNVFYWRRGSGWQSQTISNVDSFNSDSITAMKYFFIGDSSLEGAARVNDDEPVQGFSMMYDYKVENLSQAIQIANTMPIYDENNEIGTIWLNSYNTTTGVTDFSLAAIEDFNNNISFGKVETLGAKERKNMLRWSEVNSQSFPDLNFKRLREPIVAIMPAPSFLQFDYKNTFLVFTRNTINRFVLSGTPDGWSGSVSSLIEEKTQYGLLAEKSLVRAGESIFWLSESGVMKWNKDGMGLISKNIVNVPILEGAVGFYSSLKNQYLIESKIATNGDGGNGNGNGDYDPTPPPDWDFGHTISIRPYANAWIRVDGNNDDMHSGAPALVWEIVGYQDGDLGEGVSNLIIPRPHSSPEWIFDIINEGLPEDEQLNFWDYLIFEGEPVGGDGSSLPPSPGYRWIADPNPANYSAPTLHWAFPPVTLLLDESIVGPMPPPPYTAHGYTFGSGSENLDHIIIEPDEQGFWISCDWVRVWGHEHDDIYVRGFWDIAEGLVRGATLTEFGRTTVDRTRDTGEIYSYQIDRNIWTKFNNMKAIATAILTGGNELSNVNLLLNDNNQVLKYPGSQPVQQSLLRTKTMYFEKGTVRRVSLEHNSNYGVHTKFRSIIEKQNHEGTIIYKEHNMEIPKTKKWRGLPLGSNRGRSITFEVENADNIGAIGFDLRVEQ